jgi:hypothetical protein
MNKFASASMVGLLAGIVILTSAGCDWSSGGGTNSFNTSQGAGVNINFSGVYRGELSGGKVVDKTSGGNIQALTISQTGNRLTIVDNQGSTYTGTVGSPGLLALPDGTIPAGADFVQSQVSFSGKDGVSARDIEFVGIIHAVSVRDIQGKKTEKVDVSSSGSGSTNFNNNGTSLGGTQERTTVQNDGTITTTTTIKTDGAEGSPEFKQITTVTRVENSTGRVLSTETSISQNTGSGGGSSSSRSSVATTTTFTDFQISEANTQYRLEGTWIEQGGFTSGVKARSPGSAGSIQTTDTETEPVE